MQPLTRGPEAFDATASAVHLHRTPGCAKRNRRQHRAARSTCAAAFSARSLLDADMVCNSRNSFVDALFTQGLMALVPLAFGV